MKTEPMPDEVDLEAMSEDEREIYLAPPSREEIDSENHPTRKTILIAMRSLLTGDPPPKNRNKGKLSILALSNQADIGRERIVRGAFKNLGNRFNAIVAHQDQIMTAREYEFQQRNRKLTERVLDAERKYTQMRDSQAGKDAIIQGLAQQLQYSIKERARLEAKLQREMQKQSSLRPMSPGLAGRLP